MSTRAVALAVLVVGASLAVFVPAGATGGPSGTADHASDAGIPEQAHAADRAPPDLPEQWQRTYGGSGDDVFADLLRTPDGGYLLVGWNERNGTDDGWVLKVNRSGGEQWSKTLGGPGTDRFWGVVPTDDGYLLAGRTDEDGTAHGWAVTVAPDGAVTSDRTVGLGAFYAVARADGVAHGDALAAGERNGSTDGDANGSADAGYLLAGMTYGESGRVGWLARLHENSTDAWQTTVPTPEGHEHGRLRAIVPTGSGYYLAGKLTGDSDDGWAVRVDAAGEPEWQTAVGGPSRDDVWAAAPASSTPDEDGFVLAGETESGSDGPRDGWIVRFDPDGTVAWNRSPGGPGVQWLDSAMRLDDGFLFTGASDRGPNGSADGWVVATGDGGQPRWERHYGTSAWDKPWPAIRGHGDGYLLAGKTRAGTGDGDDGWLVRIGAPESDGTATDDTSGTATTAGTTGPDGTTSRDATTDATGTTTDGSDTTDAALADETATPADPSSPVPGFGAVAAMVGLLAAGLLALRR